MKRFLVLLFFVVAHLYVAAQTPVIINNYAAAISYTTCTGKLEVDTATGFSAGDKILVIQMKGLEADTSNTSSFGSVVNWNNVGTYEFNEIASISGTIFTLRYNLLRSYDYGFGKVQVVKVPSYNTYTINTQHSCMPWNGVKGGIFAIVATDSLVMHDDINVQGKGFLAGITDSPLNTGTYLLHQMDYCYVHNRYNGAMKGEGVTEVSQLRINCRGPLYNGGGGANSTNSGGGGGANAGTGGNGGKEWPGGAGGPSVNGGLGGNAFSYTAISNKVYFGGGGGAGHINNNVLANGGNGGGIVFIITNKITGNNDSIIADGQEGLSCLSPGSSRCIDGVGGGGAGGVVYINAQSVSSLNVSAKGGDGASISNNNGVHGVGGGAGGGAILVDNASLFGSMSTYVAGGAAGVFTGPGGPTTWGAAPGNTGLSNSGFIIAVDTLPILTSGSSVDTSFCQGDSVRLTYSGTGGVTWLWSTGSTDSTIMVARGGTYTVNTSNGICNFIDTFNVTVRAVPVVDLGRDTSLCPASITLRSSISYPAGTTYAWSTGAPTPTVITNASGTYILTVTTNRCSARDTTRVTILPVPNVNLGADRALCNGDSVILFSSQPAGYVYYWSNGSVNDSITVHTSGVYWLRVTGQCVASDTININVSTYPTVNLGPDTFNCVNGGVQLGNLDTNSGVTYLWSTGNSTDTMTVTLTGDYWLEVNRNGCRDRDTIHVTILSNTFALSNRDTSICLGQVVQALVSSNPGSLYQWLPTSGIAFPNSANPVIRPDTTAVYHVFVHLDGCPDFTDSFLIDVQPRPNVYVGGNRFICQFDTLHINSEVTPRWYSAYAYHWYPALNLDDTATSTVVFAAGNTQKYYLDVTTPVGCLGRDSLVVTVWPGNFAVTANDTVLCPGDSVQLHLTGGVSYLWSPTMYLSDSTIGDPLVKAETSLTYHIVAWSANGCRDTVSTRITVWPNAVVYLEDSVRIYPGESFQLDPRTNCTSVYWFPPQGLNNALSVNPIATPGTDTKYYFHGVTERGCAVLDSITLFVSPESIIRMPNAFTPGGESNTTFQANVRGEMVLNAFRIFDRWGVMVFETKDNNVGWDGTYNGKPQPFGVYVYMIEAVTNTGKVVKEQGNVTLIR